MEALVSVRGHGSGTPPSSFPGEWCILRTLTAQRLKKRRALEYQHRTELLEQFSEEAAAEMAKLGGLLAESGELIIEAGRRQDYEEYKEHDEAIYFEQGVNER